MTTVVTTNNPVVPVVPDVVSTSSITVKTVPNNQPNDQANNQVNGSWNLEIFNYLKSIPGPKKSTAIDNSKLSKVGKGVMGTTYYGELKKYPDFGLIIKKQSFSEYADNEYEALLFLREEMLAGRLPPNYIFLYGAYNTVDVMPNKTAKKPFKNFILEMADKSFDDYLSSNDLDAPQFFKLLYKIAAAVDPLEKIRMNHGDLWGENIMLVFDMENIPSTSDSDESDEVYEIDLNYTIKLIDFDAAFKHGSKTINRPARGGSDNYRTKFYLGYDMNRLFDSIMYNYTVSKQKLERYKKSTEYATNKKKAVEWIQEFNQEHINYPEEVIEFIKTFKYKCPTEAHCHLPQLAAENIMRLLAKKLTF